MHRALILIDLQNDFLDSPHLHPHRERLIANASSLLERCRRLGWTVIHVWTTITAEQDAMEHWRQGGDRRCRKGTPGHQPPERLAAGPGEWVVHKSGFSPFVDPAFADALRARGCDTLLLAGVFLRTCVRTFALDAYQRHFVVRLAEPAIGDDDPLHAAITREYLAQRSMPLLAGEALEDVLEGRESEAPSSLVHASPRSGEFLYRISAGCDVAVQHAIQGLSRPRIGEGGNRQKGVACALHGLLHRLEAEGDALVVDLAVEVGKPVDLARREVQHARALIQAALKAIPSEGAFAGGQGWWARRRPLGIVAVITPWNNPLAIPLGKIAPALLAGNSVVWKPALAGLARAQWIVETLIACGLPTDRLALLKGDDATAQALLADGGVDGISLTGGTAAGATALLHAARRMCPLQAELGGNNAAIVWDVASLEASAAEVVAGAFGFAGQRCTANRRVIVQRGRMPEFLDAVLRATAELRWGDPLESGMVMGPVISHVARERLEGVIARARQQGARIHQPNHQLEGQANRLHGGFWVPPTVIGADDPTMEVVQEESFGPLLVLQAAETWEEALTRLNGVPQGLAAALFSEDPGLQQSFLHRAEAGLLRLNRSTTGAEAEAPFGGWKSSGVGPPEHGPSAFDAFLRVQSIEGLDRAASMPD